MGGAETSWLVRSTSDRAVRVQTLVWDIALCSWVYKWVPANLMRGVTLRWTSIPSRGGVEIILVATETGDKRRPDGPLGSYADLKKETKATFYIPEDIQNFH